MVDLNTLGELITRLPHEPPLKEPVRTISDGELLAALRAAGRLKSGASYAEESDAIRAVTEGLPIYYYAAEKHCFSLAAAVAQARAAGAVIVILECLS